MRLPTSVLLLCAIASCAREHRPERPSQTGGTAAAAACPSVERGVFETDVAGAGAASFVVEATHVYWTTVEDVRRADKRTGAIEVLAAAESNPSAIVLDATHAYWLTSEPDGTSAIRRVGRAGGTVEALVTGERLWSLAVDAMHVYWASQDDRGTTSILRKSSANGGPVETLATGEDFVWALTLRGTDLHWWTQAAAAAGLRRVARAGGSVATIADGALPGVTLAVDDTHLYWTEAGHRVVRVLAAGGPAETFAAVGGPPGVDQTGPTGIGLDDRHVYWTHSSAGTVARRSKDGGEVETLAEEQDEPGELAVDASHIYWLNRNGVIVRCAKPSA